MKKLGFIIGFVCWFALAVVAQGIDENNNQQKTDGTRLEALKIAYITKRLNLTPEEAQRFWPVYNQYSTEIKQVRKNATQNNEPEINTEEKVLNIRKKYNGEFVKALSLERADEFFKCEKEFGAFVIKEWAQRRNMRMQQRRPLLRQ